MHKFKELEIWKRSRLFCSQVYVTTSNFPMEEKFGLTNQLRRASVSVHQILQKVLRENQSKNFADF